jgi:hypothetical protein
MRPVCLIATECVEVYAAGVRLSQTLILHDYAITIRDGIKFAYVRSALDRLTETFDSLARAECGFTFSSKKAKKKLDRAYEIWVSWQMSGADPDDGDSPLREVLEGCHDELDNMLTVIAKSDYLGRTFMTTDDSVDFEPDYSLRSWFRLGLMIPRGVYNDELREWQWDDRQGLEPLLADLKIELGDAFFGETPCRIIGARYPIHLAGWEMVDLTLDELRRGGAGRVAVATPPRPSSDAGSANTGQRERGDEAQCGPPTVPILASSPTTLNEHPAEVFFDRNGEYVFWYGTEYHFSGPQGAVFVALYEASLKGIPYLSRAVLLETAGSDGERLRDVFKPKGKGIHPAWGTLIVSAPKGQGRGKYGLSHPVPPSPVIPHQR